MNTWLLVTQGGAHPDGADMYWLLSFSTLGGDPDGPMPITDYQETYWPDLEERFFAGGLQDVMWQGVSMEFRGVATFVQCSTGLTCWKRPASGARRRHGTN